MSWLERPRQVISDVIAHGTPLSAAVLVSIGVKFPAQCRQDHWVVEKLHGQRGGYFADVGASNGVVSNNTFALERSFGWRGVCVEANPGFLRTLRRYRRATCVDAVVWDTDDTAIEFLPAGASGGVVHLETDNKPGASRQPPLARRTRSLASILREVGAPRVIDYMSLDIEGAENRALSTFPFEEYTVRLLTVERPSPEVEAILLDRGFRADRRIVAPEGYAVDTFFVHQSVA